MNTDTIHKDVLSTIIQAGSTMFKNRFDNLLVLSESRPLEHLHNAYNDKTAILVASGPSLSKNIQYLSNTNNKALIVACDSAVVPLLNHNIIPDYIVTVDHREYTYKKLESVQDKIKDIPLIMLSSACTKIPSTIKFKEIYYTTLNISTTHMMNTLFNENNIPLIEAVCVFNLALHAVQVMGCSTVIFTGLDLSYYNGNDHIPGTVLNWGNNHKQNKDSVYVTGIDNTPVYSSNGFIVMKEIIEKQIKEYPDTLYIDCTEGGAKVQGTVIAPLYNTIDNTHSTLEQTYPAVKEQRYSTVLDNLYILQTEILKVDALLIEYDVLKIKVQNSINKGFYLPIKPTTIELCIEQMDIINDKLNQNEIVQYTKELTAEDYNEYMSVNETDNSFLGNIKQQIFVQGMRKKAINTFLNIVTEQIEVFYSKALMTFVDSVPEHYTECVLIPSMRVKI